MKLIYADVLAVRTPLLQLTQTLLPATTSLQIVRLTKALNEHYKDYEEVRRKLVEQYGTKTEAGIAVAEKTPEFDQFIDEINKVLAQEIELPAQFDAKIKIPLEVNGKAVVVEPGVMLALDKFVELDGGK